MKKRETTAEFLARLHSDPEWVRQNQERERKRQEFSQMLADEERPLLADLAAVGWQVESVWDLVNTAKRYPVAVPVLLEHLQRPYHNRIREGIARALTVPDARGSGAWEILRELKRSHSAVEKEFRWTLINALTVVADRSMFQEIESLTHDDRFKDQLLIKRILKRISPKRRA